MVWGCISKSGVGELVKIDGSMNPEISLILICHAIPSRKPPTCFFFQHDHVMNRPPQSLNLSIIEAEWVHLDREQKYKK